MDLQTVLGSAASAVDGSSSFRTLGDTPQPRGGASVAGLISAFVPTWTTAIVFIFVFAAVRHRYPKIYAPRTYMGTISEKDRTPSQTRGWFDWVHTLRVVPDKFTLYHESIDSYLYLRFLRTLIFICVVGCVLTWPILIPINATGGGNSSQLDKITIGNISDSKKLYAHAVIAWVFFCFVMFTVARERLWLIGLRQAWNTSKSNAQRLSSRTVLFLSAPAEALDEQNYQRYFGNDAVRIWPATKTEKLESLVSSRNSKVQELEAAETTLILSVSKKIRKNEGKSDGRNGSSTTYDRLPADVKKSLRPTHIIKTPPGPVGKRVDTIEWLRDQIKEKEAEISKLRDEYEVKEVNGAAAVFVEYRTLAAAQRAYQETTSSKVLALNPRFTGVLPGEIIWPNLSLPPARRISQQGAATALVIATIAFWFIPVAFVGAISNVSYLAKNYKWLSFLNNLPDWIMGLLTGLVPPLLTSLLSKYVPNIFRFIYKKFGEPTNTSAELMVLRWFMVFQVIHVFLVTAVASGSAAAIPIIAREAAQNPIGVPALLANTLPTSANFYLTYFVVQGLTSSSDNLLNYSDLLVWLLSDYVLDKTPRQKFNRYTSLKNVAWGKVFPKYTNFAIIAIAYACIAPLVLGFAAAGLALFYVSYRYMLLYTVQPKIDTKGQAYTMALQHLLAGIYIAELSLIGLFGLRKATGPSIMIAILFILTIIFNATMDKYLKPLENSLPADLALDAEGDNDGENAPLLSSAEEGEAPSRIHRIGQHHNIPPQVLDPIARFFQPHIFASHKAMKAWLRDGDFDEDDVPEYSEDELKKAYLNPALTSSTPIVWLPRDEAGVTKVEVRENEGVDLKASDEGAWVDGKGNVKWSEKDFGEVSIFKEGVRW